MPSRAPQHPQPAAEPGDGARAPARRSSAGALALAALVAALSGLLAFVLGRRRRERALPAHAVIVSPRQSTSIARDGGVRSVQSAELTVPQTELGRLWTQSNLENLARTYWSYLTKVTLGVVRIRYGRGSRSVALFGLRPLTLLRFETPEYRFEPDRGHVAWRIRDGLLVARPGRGCGHLSLDVRMLDAPSAPAVAVPGQVTIRIEVEVANFYPSIASGLSMPVYEATQSSIHVLVTHGFLRSLATLKLDESVVGRFADADGAAPSPTAQP
jgi:hypothetical protein